MATLTGTGNDDSLVGWNGEHTLADDRPQPSAGTGRGIDTVISQVSYTLRSNVEKLRLDGARDPDGTGNALAGNDGANRLDGRDGNDVLDGTGAARVAVLFAVLGTTTHPVLSAADFVIVG